MFGEDITFTLMGGLCHNKKEDIKMRKAVLSILLLCIFMILNAVPRQLVVVEVGTGTWCQYCPGAAMGCHDLIANGHAVAIIKNHKGNNDSFTNIYSNARNSYYGITGVPNAFFDGVENVLGGGSTTNPIYNRYLPKVNTRLSVPSHYTINAYGTSSGNEYNAFVTIAKPEDDDNTNVRLHAVLTESNIAFNWFNQTTVDNVNRLMIPNQNGTNISLETGEQTTINFQFTLNSAWNADNCEIVFFLQNHSSKEILQGVKYSLAELLNNIPLNPKAPQNLSIAITGDHLTLDWDEVTEDIDGNPIQISYYEVFFSDEPYFECSMDNYYDSYIAPPISLDYIVGYVDRLFVKVRAVTGIPE